MSDVFRIFGSEMSPYSVKVRSYFRYKQIPHRWILRNAANAAEFSKYAKVPIIPLVVGPGEEAQQDSTPVIERIEKLYPEPSIHPADPVLRFVDALIEEFGDEWANKWMFHYRWAREVDQKCSAGRIALSIAPRMSEAEWAASAEKIRERMTARVWFVGSNETTAPIIEESFAAALERLDAHLASRPYLLGARPAFGDFSLWGQFYCLWTDPTTGAMIEARAPNALAWIQRMLWPRADGAFETWASLEPTLAPILREEIGCLFLPWTQANAKAIASNRQEFEATVAGRRWAQKPQKYHAKSLAALQAKYADVADKTKLDPILASLGCLEGLKAP